ncbi:MAG: hypothetical protein LLG04_00230, partial [Parachlamydia sp.]|nr:hypothetical protein [Parachlamydia sp.]
GPSYVAVLSIRVTACFFSIFGKWGKRCAEKLRSKAQSFKVCYVVHNLCNLAAVSSPLPLLSFAKNVTRCDVLRKKEDIQAANSMRERLLSHIQKQSPEIAGQIKNRMQKVTFKGDDGSGICYGASLCFLKSFLSSRCVTEKQLQSLALPLAKGFPGVAAGLQMMYEKFVDLPKKEILDWHRNQINERIAELELQIDAAKEIEAIQPIYRHLANLTTHINQVLPILQTGFKLGWVAGTCDLTPHKDNWNLTRFYQFDSDQAVRRQFDELPLGAYQLTFKAKSSGHAVTYLKCGFGSYLFDPNFGLMKCTSPAEDLQKLLKGYPFPRGSKDNARQLGVFRYELAG